MKNSIRFLASVTLIALQGHAQSTATVSSTHQKEGPTTDTAKTIATRDFVVVRVFDAPVASVWKALTESEQVKRWWGPHGFTSPLAKMDFRVGGKSLVCMRAPQEAGGQDMFSTWTYQKIEPLERIEFIFNFSDSEGHKLDPAKLGLPPGIPEDVPHVLTLKALGADKTELTWAEYGYTSDVAVEISKAGLEQCLDKMAATFTK